MNTTRAMLVIGILMLMLAVIVAQGLRPDEAQTVQGPVTSGMLSQTPELPPLPAGEEFTIPNPVSADGSSENPAGTPDLEALQEQALQAADRALEQTAAEQVSGAVSGSVPKTTVPEKLATQTRNETQKDTAKPSAATKIVRTSAPKTLLPNQRAITQTRLEVGPSQVSFTLSGGAVLNGKAFVLKEPDRVVIDLNGSWGISLGKTPENKILKSIRAGNQEANTRLVFDMHRAPKSFKLLQISPRTLELQIR